MLPALHEDPVVHPQLGDRRPESPHVPLRVVGLEDAGASVAVPHLRQRVLALGQRDAGIGVERLDVRGEVEQCGLGVIEFAGVGRVPVAVDRPEVDAHQIVGSIQDRRLAARLALGHLEEVGPGLDRRADLLGVVDPPGGAPVLAHRVPVARVPRLVGVRRVDVLEVRQPSQIHRLQQAELDHLRDVHPGRNDDVVAAGTRPGRQLGDGFLVGRVDVDLGLRSELFGELLEELGVVVLGPVEEVELVLDLSRRSGRRRASGAGIRLVGAARSQQHASREHRDGGASQERPTRDPRRCCFRRQDLERSIRHVPSFTRGPWRPLPPGPPSRCLPVPLRRRAHGLRPRCTRPAIRPAAAAPSAEEASPARPCCPPR